MCVAEAVTGVQVRGLQAQLADARQQHKEQTADKAALQARLQAANDQATAHDAQKTKLQVSNLCHRVYVCAAYTICTTTCL